ncbi:unnamed protein product [Polarella glacialis]|uniref:Tetraspanin n=1 Tax=Polarella glacialis TaxID=89957 RepID=A0A813LJL5_POLGL|nr:unnamed protein product [Polarella glacialis]|mmetsp:Transcript_5958/g.9507  ORF Transcript_5958/g.9507 Transcript_5958/m.9507 type:complete len:274 (-) Transcript_5958:53-874(-)
MSATQSYNSMNATAMKHPDQPHLTFLKRFLVPKTAVTGLGMLMLMFLSAVPITNAWMLLQDSNFTFWNGRYVPGMMFFLCAGIVLAYGFTMNAFFSRVAPENQNVQKVLSIAQVFIAFLGLSLVIVSYSLSDVSAQASSNLTDNCQNSRDTRRLFEFSKVLHNIRVLPECAGKPSVEDCQGYASAYPYTDFLKTVESDFHCSGFCTAEAGSQAALFSLKSYKVSCEGMLARDMKNFAGDVAIQTFYQGLAIASMALLVAVLKLSGLRFQKADS